MTSRRDLVNLIQSSESFGSFYSKTLERYSLTDETKVKTHLKNFYYAYLKRWRQAHRSKPRFEGANKSWLNGKETLPANEDKNTPCTSTGKRGRPKKTFDEAKERTKKEIVKSDADRLTTPQAARVLSTKLRRKGNRAGSSCVKLFASESPGSSKKILSKIKRDEAVLKTFSPEEALSLLVEAKLTKRTYSLLRISAKKKGADIYPSYKRLIEAKELTYPKNISATEKCCEVPLQDLLNHTAARIVEILGDKVFGKYVLICKWGFDGSSGQSEYKQGWEEEKTKDESVFLSSLVPLQLVGENGAIWENPRPGSTRFCRPIRLQFIKETKEVITDEEQHIKNQIAELQPLKIEELEIEFKLQLTMINGKVLCSLTGTSTLQCPLCKQTERSSASWSKTKPVDQAAFEYGISPLHAYIRLLEFVLAISYRLGAKTKTRGDKAIPEVKEQKELVLQRLEDSMHIKPDRPKQGFGSTSDGNTARRFFADPSKASKATGINEELIKRFSVILFVLSCGRESNIEKFEEYCQKTLKLYQDKYSWFPMTPTVHKILAHSPDIIRNAILPLGQLSEEAQEARNKDIRNYRQFFTRKASRRLNIKDLFCRLMLSSDPVISSARPLPKKSLRHLSPGLMEDIKDLLLPCEEGSEEERRDEDPWSTSGESSSEETDSS